VLACLLVAASALAAFSNRGLADGLACLAVGAWFGAIAFCISSADPCEVTPVDRVEPPGWLPPVVSLVLAWIGTAIALLFVAGFFVVYLVSALVAAVGAVGAHDAGDAIGSAVWAAMATLFPAMIVGAALEELRSRRQR
jgi:hypothetical protein